MVTTRKFTRRNLPHWLVTERPYFVTLRLHGTIPQTALDELLREREALRQAGAGADALTDLQHTPPADALSRIYNLDHFVIADGAHLFHDHDGTLDAGYADGFLSPATDAFTH